MPDSFVTILPVPSGSHSPHLSTCGLSTCLNAGQWADQILTTLHAFP